MNRLVIKQNLGLRYVVSRSFKSAGGARQLAASARMAVTGAILSVIHLRNARLLTDFRS